MISRALVRVIETMFPTSCVGCGAPSVALCAECAELSFSPVLDRCPRCLHAPSFGGMVCPECASDSPLLGVVTAGSFHNPILRSAVLALKDGGVRLLAKPLAVLLNEAFSSSVAARERNLCVIPVPLFPRRGRERGFNQSALIAEHVAAETGLPLCNNLLRRVRNTPDQRGQDRAERLSNLRGAFAAEPPPPSDLATPAVLLVDDVMTTGATLEEAARTLSYAGWPKIWGAVIARAE